MTTEKTNMDHAKAIIAELEGDWRVDNKQSNTEAGVYIVSGTLRLWVSNSYGVAGKLLIKQEFLRGEDNHLIEPYVRDDEEVPEGAILGEHRRARPPSIDVSPTTKRGYKHVASHIQKRLLAGARWYVQRAQAVIDATSAHERATVELAIRLQKAAPNAAKLRTKTYHTSTSTSDIKYPNHLDMALKDYDEKGVEQCFRFGYGDIDTSNNSVEMKLRSLDPELAVLLMETIEKFYNDNRGKNDPVADQVELEETYTAMTAWGYTGSLEEWSVLSHEERLTVEAELAK